jgi:transcriptional regulator with AAA-type ATPase domain/TolB-like protein
VLDLSRVVVGQCAQIVAVRDQVTAILAREAGQRQLPTLLITGETGTGKGLLAHTIHQASSRSGAQFVELSGAAIPEHLLEAELFGYERGAFTDARQSKMGLIQVAHRGTLFLDEVALLTPSLQAKLLKVIEDGSVRRLGATRAEAVDVWIISATNEDLRAAVRAKRFREDLYHRLATITLELPPLRERGRDVELLAEDALARACRKYSVPTKTLSPEAHAALRAYRWPGNVRELNSVVERAVLLCSADAIPAADLRLGSPEAESSEPGAGHTAESERQRLSRALAQTEWNISRTAAALGITRNTVRAWIAKHGLRPDATADAPAPGLSPERSGGPDPPDRPGGESYAAVAGPRSTPPDSGLARDAAPGRPSIAILPFQVAGEEQSYFGDGVVEDIIGALASLRELLVISRGSTIHYRGARVDVRQVGREVGVAYALSGSVRTAASRMRVSVELAETRRGTVVWASHFDGVSDDLFALQDQIASKVVSTIAPQVREAEMRRALRKRPESLAAYDCLLRALAQLYRLNEDDFAEARTWLEKAIALDPTYAAPYAWLADWHGIRVLQGWSPDSRTDHGEVMRLATAALERDSFDATALALCGHAKSLLLHEFDEAIALFDRAIAASPSSAIAWARSSPTYSYIGNAPEAIRRAEQALRLSPLDPHAFYPHTSLAIGHYVAGEHEEGIRWGRKAREENGRYSAALRFLAVNLAAAGQTDEAREVGRELLVVEPRFQVARFVEGYAILDPERRARLAHHLRLAGLPG